MKRDDLCALLKKIAAEAGYSFHYGSPYRMNGTVRTYPAAWMEPPRLVASKGRREGTVTYRLTVHFMALPSRSQTAEWLWPQLEEDAVAVLKSVELDSQVTETVNVSCVPANQSLTAHGESSVTLTADITMWFYI